MDFSNKLITEEIKRNDVFDLKFYLELIKKYGKENVNKSLKYLLILVSPNLSISNIQLSVFASKFSNFIDI